MTRTLVGPAPTVAPAAWASVRLIQGTAEANTWHVDSTTSRAQLTVGSAETCAWRITAAGVAHVHFELWWDGRRLWISDTRSAGGITVDGAPVFDWQELPGRARIEFGRAVMLAESSMPAVRVADQITGQEPVPEVAEELPPHAAPTLVGDPAAMLDRRRRPRDWDEESLDGEDPGSAATLILAPRPGGLLARGRGASPPAAPAAHAGRRMTPTPAPTGAPTVIRPAEPRPALFGPAVTPARSRLSVPPRTWILAAVTVGALVFVLLRPQLMGQGEAAVPAPAQRQAAAEAARPASPEEAPTRAGDAARDALASRLGAAAGPASGAADPPGGAAAVAGGGSATEAQAVELLAAGRQREALAVYDELARARPDQPAFSAIALILQRRLAARCDDTRPGATPCPTRQ